jgi:hypothetical protein
LPQITDGYYISLHPHGLHGWRVLSFATNHSWFSHPTTSPLPPWMDSAFFCHQSQMAVTFHYIPMASHSTTSHSLRGLIMLSFATDHNWFSHSTTSPWPPWMDNAFFRHQSQLVITFHYIPIAPMDGECFLFPPITDGYYISLHPHGLHGWRVLSFATDHGWLSHSSTSPMASMDG